VSTAEGDEGVSVEETEDEDEGEEEADAGGAAIAAVWYCVPVWRLWLFGFLGGWLYQARYMYCAWSAYRASFGYSRQAEWREVYERTGYRVNPLWRAGVFIYSYTLFVVIWREARLAGVRRWGTPALWAAIQCGGVVLAMIRHTSLLHNQLLSSLVLLPAQATVNAIADKTEGARRREPITATEILALLIGALLSASAYFQAGAGR